MASWQPTVCSRLMVQCGIRAMISHRHMSMAVAQSVACHSSRTCVWAAVAAPAGRDGQLGAWCAAEPPPPYKSSKGKEDTCAAEIHKLRARWSPMQRVPLWYARNVHMHGTHMWLVSFRLSSFCALWTLFGCIMQVWSYNATRTPVQCCFRLLPSRPPPVLCQVLEFEHRHGNAQRHQPCTVSRHPEGKHLQHN